jgi:hypothetical protein
MSLGFVLISLDSLVRNEPYQWVKSEKPRKIFLVAFFPVEARERTQGFGMRKVGLLMQQAYLKF